jgi:hypothetical protein
VGARRAEAAAAVAGAEQPAVAVSLAARVLSIWAAVLEQAEAPPWAPAETATRAARAAHRVNLQLDRAATAEDAIAAWPAAGAMARRGRWRSSWRLVWHGAAVTPLLKPRSAQRGEVGSRSEPGEGRPFLGRRIRPRPPARTLVKIPARPVSIDRPRSGTSRPCRTGCHRGWPRFARTCQSWDRTRSLGGTRPAQGNRSRARLHRRPPGKC